MAGEGKKNKVLAYFDEVISVLDDETFKKLVNSRSIKRWVTVFLFCVCVGINVHYRLYPAYFPQFKKPAQQIVRKRIVEEAVNKVKGMYPNYPAHVQDRLIEQTFNIWSRDKKKVRLMIDQEYRSLKDQYQDDTGQSYLLELDPYQWLRYTANVLKYGHPGEKKVNGQSYDTYMLAPVGMPVFYTQFLFYLAAFLYKILTFFISVRLEVFAFYLPVFFSIIYLSLVFFIARKIFSAPAAFFTVLFIGLTGLFINRSCAGWYDYDVLGLIIPVLITWFIVCALKNARNPGKLVAYSFLAACLQGLYAFTWSGWMFIFVVISAFFVLSMINNFCLHYPGDIKAGNKENSAYFLSALIFILGSVAFCFLVLGQNFFVIFLEHVKVGLRLGGNLSESIWPNTYYTVSELLPTSFIQIASSLYGKFIFLLSLAAVLYIYLKERRGANKDFVYIMFLWFLFMVYASLKSVRFIVFLSVPLGFFLGTFLWEMFKKFTAFLSVNRRLKFAAITFLFMTSIILTRIFSSAGERAITGMFPMMNDDWYRILTRIKNETPKDAIVNSWWDYGDLFKPFAGRRVIFDGQSQNTPLAYWMAKVITAEDEKYAARILLMINNASDTTFTFLNKYIPDQFECIAVLQKLLKMTRLESEAFLRKRGLPKLAVARVVADLYNKPVKAYFIVDPTMISKIASISLMGNWDFVKLYFYRNIQKPKNELIKKAVGIFGITREEAKASYEAISGAGSGRSLYESLTHRYFFYDPPEEGKIDDGLIYFANGLIYDTARKKALTYSCREKNYKIISMVRFNNGTREEEFVNYKNATSDRAAGIFKDDDKYFSLYMDKELLGSLYYRLIFLKGEGLKYFKPFAMDNINRIFVYEINWDAD